MPKREVTLEPGSKIELTSLRTRRKAVCEVGEVVGVGGLAKVYAATLEDGTHLVIKTQRYEGRGADHALEVEIELFKKLFHRNIVHCMGVGVDGDGHLAIGFRRAYPNPLLLMSKASVDQGMRRDRRARYPTLPLDTAIDLGYEICNALAYLERLGFVHHDVKLANLLIDVAPREEPYDGAEIFREVVRRHYRCVLIDFGATRSRNYLEAWNRGETLEGLAPQITPFYAPPEAVVESRRKGGELGLVFHPSLDVYAAALVIYAMITGHPPYSHLKQQVNPHDMESVIAAKSAERRGEIQIISHEIIQRVVFEDTKFLHGDRAAFDQALYKFLSRRLDPDPEARGTAKDMKRDFERLARIRSVRGQGPEALASGASRVFLPFQQELVVVGASGEHPLLRAARLYGLEGGEEETAGGDAAADEPGSKMEWLDDMMIEEGEVDLRRPPHRPAPPPPPRRRRPPPRRRAAPRGTRAGARPGSDSGRVPPPEAASAGPRRRRPAAEPASRGSPDPVGGLTRGASEPARVHLNVASTRSVRQEGGAAKNPLERGYPPLGVAESPHCLLSPVLDAPLLLSREKRYFIGRDPSVDVRIKSDLVSRRHAQIHYDGMGFVLTDLGSLNGTAVNNFRLQAPCPLHDEDRISFGGFEFVVRVLSGGDWSIDEKGGTTKIFKGEEDLAARATPALAGKLGQLQLRDVIDIIDWKKHSGTLQVQPEGQAPGYIYFEQGLVLHASTKENEGLDAALRLLATQRGSFQFTHGRPRCPRSIEQSIDELWTLLAERSP
ncbi:MAG: FHA domain-containing protein [Planctomycetota bacterium]|nr:MAG: FHA domain-containing protein [Planctomycetota bacterium]